MFLHIMQTIKDKQVSVYVEYTGHPIADGIFQITDNMARARVEDIHLLLPDDIASVKFLDSGMIQVGVYTYKKHGIVYNL